MLSDIFRGKVGNVIKEEQVVDDAQEKAIQLSKKIDAINGKHPLLEAGKMKSVAKSFDTKANMLMGKSIKGSMLMGTPKPLKTKGISSVKANMLMGKPKKAPKFVMPNFSQPKPPNRLNMMVPKPKNGLNLNMLKSGAMAKEQRIRGIIGGGLGKGTESPAWTRIKQQKGLNMFGDKDLDKKMNILDCNPLNKRLQGPEQKLEKLEEGEQLEEGKPLPEATEELQQIMGQYAAQPTETTETPTPTYTVEQPTQEPMVLTYGKEPFWKRVGRGLGAMAVGEARDIGREVGERLDIKKPTRKTPEQQAIEEEMRRLRKQRAKASLRGRMGERRINPKTGMVDLWGIGTSAGAEGIKRAASVQTAGYGLGRMAAITPMTQAERLVSLRREPVGYPTPTQPMAPTPTTPTTPTTTPPPVTPPMPTPSPEPKIKSPTTGRMVTYVRGPYRK